MIYAGAASAADPGRQPTRRATRRASTDETNALFERWQQHRDQRARDQLVARYMPLARKLALRYVGANEPVEDLFQVANLALVKAIDRFDTGRGLAFSSFAVPTILGELRRYFRDFGWAVHVPRAAQERALRVEQATRELTPESGQHPSVQQLAEYLEWDVSTVLDALEAGAGHHVTSLDAPARGHDEESLSLADTLGSDDERFEYVDARLTVKGAIKALPMVERRIVHMRFIDDLTQQEIGEKIGVSQMQVSRLLRSALTRLREVAEPSMVTSG
jgi:RNA polymerase sigma-B factor